MAHFSEPVKSILNGDWAETLPHVEEILQAQVSLKRRELRARIMISKPYRSAVGLVNFK